MNVPNFKRRLTQQTAIDLIGTFPSNSYGSTTNTSVTAAKALWQVLQVFLADFPEYKTSDRRVSIWTESFGEHYGPATAGVIIRQNRKIASGSLATYRKINLDTLGLVAACIDNLVEGSSPAQFAFNNTYGKQFINEATYDRARRQWSQCGGAIKTCHQTSDKLDPDQKGDNAQVNSVCRSVF
jgi:carboxypeptidase D